MQGTVKWFSKEKGYGYIVGEDQQDYYFNIREVKGTDLPNNGDVVSFAAGQGNKGPRASGVSITSKAATESRSGGPQRSDDRVTCSHCGKKMVPRIITYHGSPQKSVCPFCGETHKTFGCFIATAIYGNHYAPEVIALRRFRDETLEVSLLGRFLSNFYYKFSPPIADFLSLHPRLSAWVRIPLDALARRNE